MKKIYPIHVFLFGMLFFGVMAFPLRAAIFTWNGNVSSDWNTASNWTPAGVPDVNDDVVITSSGGAFDPVYDEQPGVRNFTISGRTLDLSGFTLQITGTAVCSGGSIVNGAVLISSASVTFGGTEFFVPVNYTGARFLLNGGRFHQPVVLIKNGGGIDNCLGGCTFLSTLTITNSDDSNLRLATSNPDTYSGNVQFINQGSGGIYAAYTASGNTFDGNLILTSSAAGGVRFGSNGGSSTLASGRTISFGGAGFSSGTLSFRNFTQIGSGTFSLSSSGSATLIMESGSQFNAALNLTFPNIQLNGAVFNGDLTITRTSASNNTSAGGNTFNGITRINNNGNGNFLLANVQPDVFNGDLYLDNNVTVNRALSVCRTGSGNQINGNLYLNNTIGTIQFGANGGITTLASGRTLLLFNDGIASGSVTLSRFIQLGNAAITLTQTSGSGALIVNNESTFGGTFTATLPLLNLNGAVFNNNFSFTKSGNTNLTCNGGNTFNGTATFSNSTSAQIILGNVNPDIFQQNLSISNSGNVIFHVARTAAGNQFNGNIIINSTGSSQGVQFGVNGGTSILSASSTIQYGTVSSGNQIYRRMVKNSTSDLSLSTSGTARIQFDVGNTINGNLTLTASNVILGSTQFNGNVTINRNGTAAGQSEGGNVFMGNVVMNIAGNGSVIYGNSLPDVYNGTLTVINTQTSGAVSFNRSGSGHQLNGNVILSNSSSGGIGFGSNGGLTTMGGTATFSIGAAGYTAGPLNLRGITKTSSSPINITQTTGSATISFLPGSDINGVVNVTFPNMLLQQTLFRSNVTLTKVGNAGSTSPGGCTFNGTFTFTNSSSGQVVFSNTQFDVFNGAANFTQTGNAITYLAHNAGETQFNGDLRLNSSGTSQGFRMGYGTGSALLADGRTIGIGAGGFTAGSLRMRKFVQTGTTTQSIVLANSSTLYLENAVVFNGVLTAQAGQVYLNGARYNNNFTATSNSSSNYTCSGGNQFYGTTTLINAGSNGWTLAGTNADAFHGNLILRAAGSGAFINPSQTASGTQFYGNVELNSYNGGAGIRFGQGNGTCTIRDGAEFYIGAFGFTSGQLRFRNLTQLGTESQDMILTGTSQLHIESGTTFNAAINFAAPLTFVSNATFVGITRLSQTGSTSVSCGGGNVFQNAAFITLSGNNAWYWGNTNPDIFQDAVTLHNSGNNVLYMAHNAAGHQFNGTLFVNSTGSSQGIRFCQGSGFATLGSGAGIEFGVNGFSVGSLRLRKLTQVGTTAINLSSNTASVALFLETGNTFNGSVTADFHQLNLNGTTFNAAATLNQRGTASIQSTGGNTFNGTTLITCTGTGEFRLAGTNPDQYNGSVTFRSTTAGRLLPAYTSEARFAGNVSTTGSATAISFSPGSGNGRVVFNGTAAQSFGGTAALPLTVRNMTINKPSGSVTLSSNVTITTNLAFTSGVLSSSSANLLILNDNCTATGMSNASYVAGPVRKVGNDAFTFPLGRGGFYRPISISAPGNTAHHFTAEYFNSNSDGLYPHTSKVASIDHLSQVEYWILNRTNGTSNVIVSLSWGANSGGVDNPGTLQVCRWDGATWRDHGNGGVNGSFVSSSGAVTSFSPFTLGSQNNQNPLPITLLNFNAEAQSSTTLVEWSTASEINNHYFEVQRSADLMEFETIARIQGAGNSNSMLSYAFTDEVPLKGMSYYRLVQTDFDGTRTEFAPVPVMHANNASGVVAFPNPFHSSFELRLPEQLQGENLQVRIFDMQGRIVQQFTQMPNAPVSGIQLGDALPGLYFVEIQSAKGAEVIRLIKQ
jgi:hypothetical protein